MSQSNVSNSTSSAEHSAFQSTQFALTRKPLPGPTWAWSCVAALAVAGVAFLVAGSPGEHATHHAAPSPSTETEVAALEAAKPTPTAAVTEPTPGAAAAPAAVPAVAAPAPAAAPVNDVAVAAPKAAAEPAKANDDAEHAVASAAPSSTKKARGAGHRNHRKASARPH